MKNNYERLEENPLFQISLGSKELFHSNFLYWLSIKYPKEFGLLFAELSNDKNLGEFSKCTRETKNIDLTVEYENDIIYIENKVKSIATKKQLDDYKDKLTGKNTNKGVFLFLGLFKPSFFDKNYKYEGWKYVSYKELKKQIKERIPGSEYRDDYINFIEALSEVSKKFEVKSDENINFIDNEDYKKCKKLRIHDLYLKRKFIEIGNRVFKNHSGKINRVYGSGWLRTMDMDKENRCFLNCDFNNGKGTLTLDYRIDSKWTISVQLEGNTYRHCLFYVDKNSYLSNNNGEEKIRRISKKLKDDKIWFDSRLKDRWDTEDIKGNGRSGDKGFNQYFIKRKNYEELFLYRYVQLKNNKVQDVVDAFKCDFNYIEKKISDIHKLITK